MLMKPNEKQSKINNDDYKKYNNLTTESMEYKTLH